MKIDIKKPESRRYLWPELAPGTVFRFTNMGENSTVGLVIQHDSDNYKQWMMLRQMNNSPQFPLGKYFDCCSNDSVEVIEQMEFTP